MLYVLHFEPRYRHAGHYLGYTSRADLFARLDEHSSGGAKASPLVRAALGAGCRIFVARIYPNGTRTFERRLKRRGSSARCCPICRRS